MIDSTLDLPETWDAEADFVVLGSGGGGMTGAITASIRGLRTILLEKTDLIGGTSSMSGGTMWIPVNHHMPEVGIADTRDEAMAYLRACSSNPADDAIITALVDHGRAMVRFLEDSAGMFFRPWPSEGCAVDYRSHLPGAKRSRNLDPGKFAVADLGDWAPALRTGPQSAWLMDRLEMFSKRLHVSPPLPNAPSRVLKPGQKVGDYLANGSALTGQLLKACLKHGVSILTGTPASQLLVERGRVVGVRAQRNGKPFFVQAKSGVLVATGGYSHNEELKRLWLDRPIDYSCEIVENQGDGHLMGMAVGAQTAGLGDAWWFMQGAPHVNRYVPHTMIVNREGRRFCDESINYYDFADAFGSRRSGMRNLPAWMLFDTQGATKYSVLNELLTMPPRTEFIPAGAGAVIRPTMLTQAGSLDELAGKLGIDAQQLERSVAQFNEYARDGHDPEFHRGETRWSREWGDPNQKPNPSLGELKVPPFYAVEIRPGALATRGGLRVNEMAEVLSAGTGGPIPGLYAAGNCSSGAVPYAYPGFGATLGAAMTFAYIAANGAAMR